MTHSISSWSLINRLSQKNGEAIYVNDNFGQWRSDLAKLLAYCLRPQALGRQFVEQIRPEKDDYFVLKPRHSAFYHTPLEVGLEYLGASSLVLCGLATHSLHCLHSTRRQDAKFRSLRSVRLLSVPNNA